MPAASSAAIASPALESWSGTVIVEPATLAAAEAADLAVEQLGDPEQRGELVDARPGVTRVDAPQVRVQLEVGAAGQAAVDDGLLEHHARDTPRRERPLYDVVAAQH